MARKKASRIRDLRFSHVAICDECSVRFDWPSPPPDPEKSVYVCPRCKRDMRVETIEDMSREEAERIDRYRNRFEESCPSCESTSGLEIRQAADVVAFFLYCGSCGEEIREIDESELDPAEREALGLA